MKKEQEERKGQEGRGSRRGKPSNVSEDLESHALGFTSLIWDFTSLILDFTSLFWDFTVLNWGKTKLGNTYLG